MEHEVSTVLISGKGLWFLGAYMLTLIAIGFIGRHYSKEGTMADFYLSGRGMGFMVLFFTLYATQYSGNTLIGFSGNAYRDGFYFLVSVAFMMGVVAVWLVYAPKLQKLSKKYKFITPGDFLQHRYASRALTILATLVCIFALGNYIVTNLKAVGDIVVSSTGGAVTFKNAIIVSALIMVIYETLGGMRSVSWTDTIQGILLLVGCVAIFWAINHFYGGLIGTADILMNTRSEDMWAPPSDAQKRTWLSTLVMFSLGIAMYPHAIQRIYASKDSNTLRKSFQIMLFMPLVTTFFILIVGIVGAAQFPGIEDREAQDSISLLLLADLVSKAPWFRAVAVLFICAAVAAIMSTVDSALLTLSSMFSKDLFKPLNPKATQHTLLMAGKYSSWVIMALGAWLAISLSEDIYTLITIKLDVLCQIAPAIILGLYYKKLDKKAVFWGMLAGILLVCILNFANGQVIPLLDITIVKKPWAIHAGIWGLILNLVLIWLITLFQRGAKVIG